VPTLGVRPGGVQSTTAVLTRFERISGCRTGNPHEKLVNTEQIARCRSGIGAGRKEAMNSTYKIAAAVIGSFVLGVGAANVLHAQAKPPGFVLAEIDVKDKDGYTNDFLPKARDNIKESGGKYLAGGFNKTISMSGSPPPNRVVLLQFADMDAVKAYNAKQRQLEAEVGDKYASFRAFGIEGVEQK
jgi:uncharacterized protein (DUF1330 family)